MDCRTRIKRIRMIDKMTTYPETSRKLGLKDKSYFKEEHKFRRAVQIS